MNTIPTHKFNALVEHCKHLLNENARLHKEVLQLRYVDGADCWHWMPEGGNQLDSLVCPVLIQAEDLRELLAGDHETGATQVPPELNPADLEISACGDLVADRIAGDLRQGVSIRHLPTGLCASSTHARTTHHNRRLALEELTRLVHAHYLTQKART